MNMQAKMRLQMKAIHHYAVYLGVDDEIAAKRWCESALAKTWAHIVCGEEL